MHTCKAGSQAEVHSSGIPQSTTSGIGGGCKRVRIRDSSSCDSAKGLGRIFSGETSIAVPSRDEPSASEESFATSWSDVFVLRFLWLMVGFFMMTWDLGIRRTVAPIVGGT